jgi:prophage regulatory protein
MSDNPETILRLPAVCAAVGLRRSSIYRLLNEGRFPQPIPIQKRAKGWLASEIQSWIRARAASRNHAA